MRTSELLTVQNTKVKGFVLGHFGFKKRERGKAKQTNKQTNKPTGKRTSKRAGKQAVKHASKYANKQTKKGNNNKEKKTKNFVDGITLCDTQMTALLSTFKIYLPDVYPGAIVTLSYVAFCTLIITLLVPLSKCKNTRERCKEGGGKGT